MFKRLTMVWILIVGIAASLGSGAPMLLCVGADGHIDRKSGARDCARMCPPSPTERSSPPPSSSPFMSAAPTAADSPECCLDVPVAGGESILTDRPSRPPVVRFGLQVCPVVASQAAQPSPYASSIPPAVETTPPSLCSLRTIVLLI